MSHSKLHDEESFCTCPHCGSDIRENATFCRECGASDDSGWGDSDESYAMECDGDFDYDTYVAREFGNSSVRPWRLGHYLVLATLMAFAAGIIATVVFATG